MKKPRAGRGLEIAMSWIDWVQAWESLQRVILIVGAYELGRWLWPKVGRKLFRPSKHASQNRDQGPIGTP